MAKYAERWECGECLLILIVYDDSGPRWRVEKWRGRAMRDEARYTADTEDEARRVFADWQREIAAAFASKTLNPV